MEHTNYTPEAVASMASKLIAAGQDEAAAMLHALFARAQAAEKDLYALRHEEPAELAATRGPAITDADPPVGESLEEISQGRHVGP